jgi:hypothetical protein
VSSIRVLVLFLVSVPVNFCLTHAIENRIGVRSANWKSAPGPFRHFVVIIVSIPKQTLYVETPRCERRWDSPQAGYGLQVAKRLY